MPQEPCSSAPIKPRERAGQVSIAKAAPAGHSAPMPMPSKARNRNKTTKVGASPAIKLHTEYQAIEIIRGARRPIRSASQPFAVAPINRPHRVSVSTKVTSVTGTSKYLEIGAMSNRKIVKSNASRVQPSHAATHAYHWSLVGSRYHGSCTASAVAIAFLLPVDPAPRPSFVGRIGALFTVVSRFYLPRLDLRQRPLSALSGSPLVRLCASGFAPLCSHWPAPLFDDLIGALQQRLRDGKTERLGGLHVDDKFKFRRLLDWKVSRSGSRQDFVDVNRRATEQINVIRPVGNEVHQHRRMTSTQT